MSELMSIMQTEETFNSGLVQALKQCLLEHSKAREGTNTTTTIPVSGGPTSSAPIPIRDNVNLNLDPSLLSKSLDTGMDIHSLGCRKSRSQSLQITSPYLQNFRPGTPGSNNINAEINDNNIFVRRGSGATNLNPNYSSGAQNINDNMPFPLDNLDPCTPSTSMTLNTSQLTSTDSLTLDNINQLNNIHLGTSASIPRTTTENMNRINSVRTTQSETTTTNKNANLNANFNTNTRLSIKEEPEEEEDVVNIAANMATLERIMSEVKEPTSAERLLLVDHVTETILHAHLETTGGTREKVDQAFERIASSPPPAAMCEKKMEMMKMMMKAGPSAMWQKMLSQMVPEMERVIKFSQMVPGFSEVGEEDQVNLIKQGSFEVMLARQSILVDPIKETMLDPSLTMASPREMIRKMPTGEFMDKLFTIAKEVHPLRLDDNELGLFSAILILCPDRSNIADVRAVRLCQQLFQQALFLLMRNQHTDTYETRFRTLMSLVPLFRKTNNDHSKFLRQHQMKSPVDFANEFPSLAKEIYLSE